MSFSIFSRVHILGFIILLFSVYIIQTSVCFYKLYKYINIIYWCVEMKILSYLTFSITNWIDFCEDIYVFGTRKIVNFLRNDPNCLNNSHVKHKIESKSSNIYFNKLKLTQFHAKKKVLKMNFRLLKFLFVSCRALL